MAHTLLRPRRIGVALKFAVVAAVISPLVSAALWGAVLQMWINDAQPSQTTDAAVMFLFPLIWGPLGALVNLVACARAISRPGDGRVLRQSVIALAAASLVETLLLWGSALQFTTGPALDSRVPVVLVLGVAVMLTPAVWLWLARDQASAG